VRIWKFDKDDDEAREDSESSLDVLVLREQALSVLSRHNCFRDGPRYFASVDEWLTAIEWEADSRRKV
jgi:hypothetical protein